MAQFFNGGGQVRIDLVNGCLQRVVRFFHRVTQSGLHIFQILYLGAQCLISRYKFCNVLGEADVLCLKRFFKSVDLIPQLLDQSVNLLVAHDKQAERFVGGHASHIFSFVKRDNRKRGALGCISAYINGDRAVRVSRRIAAGADVVIMLIVVRIEMCYCHTSRFCCRSCKGQGDFAF